MCIRDRISTGTPASRGPSATAGLLVQNESVAYFWKVQRLVTMAVQQRYVIQSFLWHSWTQKYFELPQAWKTSFCYTTRDRQREIQSRQVHYFWEHLWPHLVVHKQLHDVTDVRNSDWNSSIFGLKGKMNDTDLQAWTQMETDELRQCHPVVIRYVTQWWNIAAVNHLGKNWLYVACQVNPEIQTKREVSK